MQSYNAIVGEGGVASNKFWWHYIYIANSNLHAKIGVPRYYINWDFRQKPVFFFRGMSGFSLIVGEWGVASKKGNKLVLTD